MRGRGLRRECSFLTFRALSVFLMGNWNTLNDMKHPSIHAALICAGFLALPSLLSGQTASPTAATPSGPRLTFVTKEHHFGRITSGEKVKCVYAFTNTGD